MIKVFIMKKLLALLALVSTTALADQTLSQRFNVGTQQYATPSQDGLVSTAAQNFGGSKYFTGGNVGIGTTAPSANLEIQGALGAGGYAAIVGNGSTANTLKLGASTISPFELDITTSSTSYPIALQPSGGNVGIGTTAPNEPLTVVGAGASAYTASFSNPASGPNGLFINMFSGPAYAVNLQNTDTATQSTAGSLVLNANGGSVGIGTNVPLTFLDVGGLLNVTSGGNVGIGSTNPQDKLDIVGNISASSNVFSGARHGVLQGGESLGVGTASTISGGGQGGTYTIYNETLGYSCLFLCTISNCTPVGPSQCTAAGAHTGIECLYASGIIRCYNYTGSTYDFSFANTFVQ